MREQFRDAIVRAHAPMSLLLWDRLSTGLGVTFGALGGFLWAAGAAAPAAVSVMGGGVIFVASVCDRRRHEAAVWALAAAEPDPIAALALYDYLYRLRFGDVLDLAHWWDGNVDQPPLCLLALHAHMEDVPRER